MATLENVRITAILLRNKLSRLYADVMPLYAISAAWNVSGLDVDLPDEGEVKAVLDRYSSLEILAMNVRASLSEVSASKEIFPGPWPTLPPECGSSGEQDSGLMIPQTGIVIPQEGLLIRS